jgi:hypothetical protein
MVKVKVESKGKGKFTLELATKAQRGVEIWLYSFNLGARWGGWSNATPRTLYLWKRDPVPTV